MPIALITASTAMRLPKISIGSSASGAERSRGCALLRVLRDAGHSGEWKLRVWGDAVGNPLVAAWLVGHGRCWHGGRTINSMISPCHAAHGNRKGSARLLTDAELTDFGSGEMGGARRWATASALLVDPASGACLSFFRERPRRGPSTSDCRARRISTSEAPSG